MSNHLTTDKSLETAVDNAKSAAANTAHKVEEATQTLAQTTAETTAKAGEAVKETVQHTGEVLEIGTNQALEFFGVPINIDALIALMVAWSGKLVLALLIFFIGKWVGKRVLRVADLAMSRSRLDNTAASFLSNVLYGLMLVAVTLAALNKLGVNTNSFVAILGAAAVAIGMALKDQLGNLAAGVMIVMFRPFNRGDSVEIAGQIGTVIDITLVNTRIRTANNHEIIIPNGDIMTSASTNFSSLPQRRVDVVVGISYDSDIQAARELMIAEAHRHESVLDVPEPLVRVTALGDNAVNLTLYVWAENGDWWGVQCDLLECIKYSFDKHGINLPFPQRSVHIEGLNLDKVNQLLNQKPAPNLSPTQEH